MAPLTSQSTATAAAMIAMKPPAPAKNIATLLPPGAKCRRAFLRGLIAAGAGGSLLVAGDGGGIASAASRGGRRRRRRQRRGRTPASAACRRRCWPARRGRRP
ncbi:hypothetical protein EE612_048958 [Oryza sativa]|nr:hypothetical protein EE612_048958 [Oryza sativa]